ncbi:unnamed protein product, partial [marine sediment metagenome]
PPKWYEEYGTYYNYGFPLVSILLAAFGIIRGDWETRLVTAGATLAGGKAYNQIKAAAPAGYKWTRQSEAKRQAAEMVRRQAEEARKAAAGASPLYIEEEEILA